MQRGLTGLAAAMVASVSVALYYNITFFGKALVALPSLPVSAGCLLYYLSAFNTTPPTAQVALWMLCFGFTSFGWWSLLGSAISRLAKVPSQDRQRVLKRAQLGLWLYALPLPWLLWVHAQSPEGPSVQALTAAVLERKGLYWNSMGWEPILNGLFLLLAVAETALTGLAVEKACQNRKTSILSLSLAGAVLLVLVSALAPLLFQLSAGG